MRKLPITVQQIIKGRASDFGGTSDRIVDIGPSDGDGATPYIIGATVKHLSAEEKAERGYDVNLDTISVNTFFAPTLEQVQANQYQLIFQGHTYRVLTVDRLGFNDRNIRIIAGRNL